jgi:hypothetical protein
MNQINIIRKAASVLVIVSLVAALLPYTVGEFQITKIYRGPRIVYKEIDAAKGRPSSPPGLDKKPPKEEEPQPDPSINKWAVVIGISDYRGRLNDLRYCDDDAQDMYNYLIAKGYPEGNIKLLLNGDAKAKAIVSAIDWLSSWENENSEVVFFYSGHGSTYDGYDDGDTEYTDEAIVSADLYLILDGQLRQKFETFESQKISFIFDSCFSGGMDDLVGAHTSTTYIGRVVVTASDEDQYSWEGDETMQNGVFTYHYMDGLYTYNTVEGAYSYAAPLAHDDVLSMYGAIMDPQLYDEYPGDWAF